MNIESLYLCVFCNGFAVHIDIPIYFGLGCNPKGWFFYFGEKDGRKPGSNAREKWLKQYHYKGFKYVSKNIYTKVLKCT